MGARRRPHIALPGPAGFKSDKLRGDKFRQPLAVGMAALVAHERGNWSALDLDRLDLARAMADHEYRRMERIAAHEARPAFLLLHLAAYVTCTGRLTEPLLTKACQDERELVEPGSQWTAPQLQGVIA